MSDKLIDILKEKFRVDRLRFRKRHVGIAETPVVREECEGTGCYGWEPFSPGLRNFKPLEVVRRLSSSRLKSFIADAPLESH